MRWDREGGGEGGEDKHGRTVGNGVVWRGRSNNGGWEDGC